MPLRWLPRNTWWKWGLVLALWTFIGLSFAAQFYFTSAQFGQPVSWRRAVGNALTDWYLYALLSLPAFGLARRWPLEAPNFWRHVTFHLLGSGLFSLLYMVLRACISQWRSEVPITFAAVFDPLLVKTFHFNVLVYWMLVSLRSGLDYYRKYRERELRTIELEKRLAEARLQALQMQLNPHFLFNTLNAVAALLRKDPDAAERMLARLSDLLRLALDSAATQEVRLRDELDFLSRYLELEQIRFGGRLQATQDVPPDTLDALVPNLLLQPLVENAVRHGVAPHARPGVITLRARREGERLCLRVSDNGSGLPRDRPAREGVGLSNTRARLHQLYGDAHRLQLENDPQGGLVVHVELPFHTAPLS